MIGDVVALEPAEYAEWLEGGPIRSRQDAGKQLYDQFRCGNCHANPIVRRCPPLDGVFGSQVRLTSGQTVTADEAYLRESIVDPQAKVVAGYQPVMPTYKDQIGEAELFDLIAYLKSSGAAAHAAQDLQPRIGRAQMTTDQLPRHHYLNANYNVWSWLLSTDHKRIAILYMISLTMFFFVGGAAAVLFRLELMTPRGDLVIAETYNKLFTLHGVIMVWFFLIPSVPTVLGNFLLPMMIGARDLAFPRLNLASWYLFVGGGMFTIWALLTGGVDTGWTFYTPYSSTYANTRVMLTAVGVFVSGFSTILTGLNFIVTIHTMRAPGMTWFRMPLFVWAHYANSLVMVLATPVLAVTLLLIGLERVLGLGIFDPHLGGDPLLFQHLFWFYSHPAVYLMVLPAMGVVSEVITCFARKPIFGYPFIAFSSLSIAVLGFLVWGHHMFVSGQSVYAGTDVFVSEHAGGDSLGGESVQLDGHLAQRHDLAGHSDAVRTRIHRPVYPRRVDRRVSGHAGRRPACSRHLLRRGPFPLHHGRRHRHGLPGGHSLLVAENDGPEVSRMVGPHFRRADLFRLQSDVLSTVLAGLPGHAAALSCLSRRVPGAQRHVDRGRIDSGNGLLDSPRLFAVVAAIRPGRRAESLERNRPRMANTFAAADL